MVGGTRRPFSGEVFFSFVFDVSGKNQTAFFKDFWFRLQNSIKCQSIKVSKVVQNIVSMVEKVSTKEFRFSLDYL